MNNKVRDIILNSDSRYLSSDEKSTITTELEQLPKRIRAAELIEEAEEAAVRYCIDETRKKYPNFEKFHDKAWAKAFRDVQLTVRYDVQAMILDDMLMLDDKLLFWLRTILSSFNFTPEFNRDTYLFLKQGFAKRLSPDAFALFEPYLDRNIAILSEFPSPATPAV